MKAPMFDYVSICCSAPATKPPCVAVPKAAKKGKTEKALEFASLGKWSCGACGRACKVHRHLHKAEVKSEAING